MRRRLFWFTAVLLASSALFGQERAIDTQRSKITIHVFKAGLLSAAAHNHTVDAPIATGAIHESAPAHIEFTVEAAKMKVLPDPKIDAKDQATIQTHMEELTLEANKFPQIVFRSTRAEKSASGDWKVDGNLTLHGVTKPVSLIVKRAGDGYTTHTVLKQTDFGITPIRVAGGIIKVKDEIELDFQIFPAKT